jgi:hypothetical protein
MLTATGKLTLRLDDVVDYVHDNFVGLLHVSGEQLRFVLLPRRYRLNAKYPLVHLLFATDGFGEAVEEDGGEVVELGHEFEDGLNLSWFVATVDLHQAGC